MWNIYLAFVCYHVAPRTTWPPCGLKIVVYTVIPCLIFAYNEGYCASFLWFYLNIRITNIIFLRFSSLSVRFILPSQGPAGGWLRGLWRRSEPSVSMLCPTIVLIVTWKWKMMPLRRPLMMMSSTLIFSSTSKRITSFPVPQVSSETNLKGRIVCFGCHF